jgi:hypothetical protein
LLGWHYPSDVVGSFLVCGFWASALAAALPNALPRPQISPGGALFAVGMVAAGLLLAALVAGRHPTAVAALRSSRSVVATGAAIGLLSVALFGAFVAVAGEARE